MRACPLALLTLSLACAPTEAPLPLTDGAAPAGDDAGAGLADAAATAADGSSPATDAAPEADAAPPARDAEPAVRDAEPAAPDAGAPATPSIADALGCGRPASAGGLANGTELARHDLDLARFPDALCNDGTGAVIYFRPFVGAQNRDRWVIQLQGGGGCRNPDDCARRWCSLDTNFGMTQMTAALAPRAGTVGDGIFARRADNPLGSWNQVLLRYCSSDTWSGSARDVVVQVTEPRVGGPLAMRLHFMGSKIFDATIATLRQDGVPALRQGAVELPDLDEAEQVVLAGASAGGGGVINNLDRLADLLRVEAPRAQVRGLIDSTSGPALAALDLSATALCTDHGLCSWEALMQAERAQGSGLLWQPRRDDSCPRWHQANLPGTEWQCDDSDHVMNHHLTTPFFVRQGQQDELLSGNAIDAGFVVPGRGPMTLALFAELVRAQLAALPELPRTAHEGAAITVAPGAFGPTCSKHETLRSTPDTFGVSIGEPGARDTMFDVIGRWTRGESPSVAITPPGGSDVCP